MIGPLIRFYFRRMRTWLISCVIIGAAGAAVLCSLRPNLFMPNWTWFMYWTVFIWMWPNASLGPEGDYELSLPFTRRTRYLGFFVASFLLSFIAYIPGALIIFSFHFIKGSTGWITILKIIVSILAIFNLGAQVRSIQLWRRFPRNFLIIVGSAILLLILVLSLMFSEKIDNVILYLVSISVLTILIYRAGSWFSEDLEVSDAAPARRSKRKRRDRSKSSDLELNLIDRLGPRTRYLLRTNIRIVENIALLFFAAILVLNLTGGIARDNFYTFIVAFFSLFSSVGIIYKARHLIEGNITRLDREYIYFSAHVPMIYLLILVFIGSAIFNIRIGREPLILKSSYKAYESGWQGGFLEWDNRLSERTRLKQLASAPGGIEYSGNLLKAYMYNYYGLKSELDMLDVSKFYKDKNDSSNQDDSWVLSTSRYIDQITKADLKQRIIFPIVFMLFTAIFMAIALPGRWAYPGLIKLKNLVYKWVSYALLPIAVLYYLKYIIYRYDPLKEDWPVMEITWTGHALYFLNQHFMLVLSVMIAAIALLHWRNVRNFRYAEMNTIKDWKTIRPDIFSRGRT